MSKLRDRLFFYSSRQLYRRRRSYLSIFIVSVVLLTLVMTFLGMIESYFLRTIEIQRHGTHHAVFLEQLYDLSEDIERNKKVESAFAVPYSSRLASSDDASSPGKLTVVTPEISDYLHVRYLWGRAPEDGEIAVPVELYNAYDYLAAGEENELYFKASEMTYFPLKLCGIFETGNALGQYVFVTQKTADAIDRETRAVMKYDNYFRCKHSSNRYIGMVVHELFKDLKLSDTDLQSRRFFGNGNVEEQVKTSGAWKVYEEYINGVYLSELVSQSAAPLVLISLPVIIIAALLLASFMSNWMMTNSPEYGILGAIGANRLHICTMAAGQILLIAALSSVPVVLLSALASNIYISAFNAASATDVDFVYTIPWGHVIRSALWYVLLSCLFTYIATDRLTRLTPFTLISGSYRGELPFVQRTYTRLGKSKDKIRQLSLLTAMRNIRSEIVPAVITTLICLVCGAFALALIFYRSAASSILENLRHYESDTVISMQADSYLAYQLYGNRKVYLTDEHIRRLRETEGVSSVGAFRSFYSYMGEEISEHETLHRNPCILNGASGGFDYSRDYTAFSCNEDALSSVLRQTLEGDPSELFRGENRVILLVPQFAADLEYHAGDVLTLSEGYISDHQSGMHRCADAREDFTVAAVAVANVEAEDFHILSTGLLFTDEGAAQLGLGKCGEYSTLLVNYDRTLPNDVLQTTVNELQNDPAFLRFDVTDHAVRTDSEKRIEAATTWMLVFFFGMLYLVFCVTTFIDSSMKVNREKRELSVLRQLGADERDILKAMRTQTYPTTALALAISLLLPIGATIYLLVAQSNITALADYEQFSAEVIAAWRQPVYTAFLVMLVIWLADIPILLFSGFVSVLGTVFPTRRLFKSSIVEGIRKDTD